MKNTPDSKYKNIDKSSVEFFSEKEKFSVLNIRNQNGETAFKSYPLTGNYIQLYFSMTNRTKVAFNMEHCAVELSPEDSALIYFKDPSMNLLFTLPPQSEVLVVLISVTHFHSLFSHSDDLFFNFNNLKIGRPIIDQKKTHKSVRSILQQILTKQVHGTLHGLYTKGKIYELLSLYFDNTDQNESDSCPFMANEETVAQIKKAKDIIIENMAHPPSLEELSKKVGLNIKKLKVGFKEFYGAPVFTFLLNYKLDHSKKLLEENQFNVSEIAAQIGYSNSSHFIAAFKKKFDTTPKQFTRKTNSA